MVCCLGISFYQHRELVADFLHPLILFLSDQAECLNDKGLGFKMRRYLILKRCFWHQKKHFKQRMQDHKTFLILKKNQLRKCWGSVIEIIDLEFFKDKTLRSANRISLKMSRQ
jgi:hypothetical protein